MNVSPLFHSHSLKIIITQRKINLCAVQQWQFDKRSFACLLVAPANRPFHRNIMSIAQSLRKTKACNSFCELFSLFLLHFSCPFPIHSTLFFHSRWWINCFSKSLTGITLLWNWIIEVLTSRDLTLDSNWIWLAIGGDFGLRSSVVFLFKIQPWAINHLRTLLKVNLRRRFSLKASKPLRVAANSFPMKPHRNALNEI